MENNLKQIKSAGQIKNLVITKVHYQSKYGRLIAEMYVKHLKSNVRSMPDWVVFKYSKGKFKYHLRHIGSLSKPALINRLN